MPRPMRVPFARLHPEAELPRRMSAQAAGLDLVACLGDGGRIELAPGGRALMLVDADLPAGRGQWAMGLCVTVDP